MPEPKRARVKSKRAPDRVLDLQVVLSDMVKGGLITEATRDRVSLLSRTKDQAGMHLLTYLAEQRMADARRANSTLSLEQLVDWLAQQAGQPTYYIDPLKIDVAAVTEVMSLAFARRHNILAVENNNDHVTIASAQPYVSSWEADLEHILRKPIHRVVANPVDIARYTSEFYTLERSITGASGRERSKASTAISNFEQLLELGSAKDPDANDQHIINIVDWLLQYAFDQRASDIHIEPRRDKGNIRFRIDGMLHTVYQMPMQILAAVSSRIKVLGRMNVAEKRRPQDGRLKTVSAEGNEVELRLATMPTAFGEKLVMRIFDPDVLLKSFEDLGLANEDLRRWNNMTARPNGIVLVTGPTGSGKTTTLYSTLRQLAKEEVNVCTIEDPIEMVEGAFNQMQVQHNIELDFASGVRALMRQDPDIIMVGEIRDLETADMAIQAALTGHLVLSTLHTNDSPSAVTRMLELGVPAYLIKATVLGVMAQRLVRTLCPHCKQPTETDLDAWKQLVRPWKVAPPPQQYMPVGCVECRKTGYLGRQGIYEVLILSEQVKESIQENCDIAALRRIGMKEGMKTLRLAGAQKILAGDTTIEEVMRVAPALDSQ